MISLGAICQDIMYRDDATIVLTEHATYTWNKAGTRIRCNGDSCGIILEAPDGPASTAVHGVFARHQAEQLPEPFIPEAEPVAVTETPVAPEDQTGSVAAEPDIVLTR